MGSAGFRAYGRPRGQANGHTAQDHRSQATLAPRAVGGRRAGRPPPAGGACEGLARLVSGRALLPRGAPGRRPKLTSRPHLPIPWFVALGGVPEWLNGAVSKTVGRASGSRVRIPPPPLIPTRPAVRAPGGGLGSRRGRPSSGARRAGRRNRRARRRPPSRAGRAP